MMNEAAQAALNYAAKQAWIGLWRGYMQQAGGESQLPFDEGAVAAVLDVPVLRVLPKPEPSAWAQRLQGDGRLSDVTLDDVIAGLDDYFVTFAKVRKVNPAAYSYFSRIGVPLCLDKMAIWRKSMDGLESGMMPVVANHQGMPGYMGLFFPTTAEKARETWVNDESAFLDFQLYEKRRRNVVTVAPPGWTIFDHQQFHLPRSGVVTSADRRKYPGLVKTWGFQYFLGIGPDGAVRALPMQWERQQRLKSGDVITHSKFSIPAGLTNLKNGSTPHGYAAWMFVTMSNFAATALSGAQVSIRRGEQVARFGVPISYLKSFFRDRDAGGGRRNPILHYVADQTRTLADGREILVGEHLRGARKFSWRGHEVVVGAPGIHHASPEALSCAIMTDEDVDHIPSDGTPIWKAADVLQHQVEQVKKVPMRKGQPTLKYPMHGLDGGSAS